MKKLFLIACVLTVSSMAQAHDSLVPHTHPHGVSVLPDLYAMLAAAFLVACGVFAIRMLKGRS
jgi:hypothetical protein